MGLLELARKAPQVGPGVSVAHAVSAMVEARVGALAVMDGPKIAGVFTERDLMRRVVEPGKDPHTTVLRDVMTSPVITVTGEMSVATAAALMRKHHVRHLAIVDAQGDYLGMLALRYLLYDILEDLELKVGDLSNWVMADARGG